MKEAIISKTIDGMKKTLLLMVLALVMCINNTSAQSDYTMKKQVEENGFTWYLVCNREKLEGVANANKDIIIPPNFKWISFYNNDGKSYFEVTKSIGEEYYRGVCDILGREVFSPKYQVRFIYSGEEFKLFTGEGYQSMGVHLDSDNMAYRKKYDGTREYLYELFAKDSSGKEYYKSHLGEKYGLINDNNIILSEDNDEIKLTNSNQILYKKNGYYGIKSLQGKTIISINDKYSYIGELSQKDKTYYTLRKNSRYGLADNTGKIIIPCEMEALESAGSGYLKYKLNGFWGVMNYTGKVIIDTNRGYTSIGDFKTFNKRFAYTMPGYKGECDATGRQISKIKVATSKPSTVASSSSSSSTTSSSSNKKSGSGTTKVVVEHQHTPQPVQQWQACFACGGMGKMGCDNCGGSGTKYIGDRLHRCSRCNGRGEIPCNTCYGNKGQYITVYR